MRNLRMFSGLLFALALTGIPGPAAADEGDQSTEPRGAATSGEVMSVPAPATDANEIAAGCIPVGEDLCVPFPFPFLV
jgi:hypothetical protein